MIALTVLLTRGGQSVLVQAVRNCREAADRVSRPANAPTTYVCRGDRCFASMLSRCALTAAGKMQRMQSTIHNEYIRWCDRRYIVLLLVIHDSGPGARTAVIETGAFISMTYAPRLVPVDLVVLGRFGAGAFGNHQITPCFQATSSRRSPPSGSFAVRPGHRSHPVSYSELWVAWRRIPL